MTLVTTNLFPAAVLAFLLTSCACPAKDPPRPPVKNAPCDFRTLENVIHDGLASTFDDVECLCQNRFLYRIRYLAGDSEYTFETRVLRGQERSDEDIDGDGASGTVVEKVFGFLYQGSQFSGAFELGEDEFDERFLINQCLGHEERWPGCFEEFTAKVNDILSQDRYVTRGMRGSDRLIDTSLEKEQLSAWHLLWAVPTFALLHTPAVIFFAPPALTIESINESKREDVDALSRQIALGDDFSTISATTDLSADLSDGVNEGTGTAEYTETVMGRSLLSLGIKGGTVVWTRKCNYDDGAVPRPGICPTLDDM